jgi:hypothetical protein
MAMTNFGTNDPLAVKLWSKSLNVEALSTLIILPDDGAGGLQPLALPPPGRCSARGYSPCTHNMGKYWVQTNENHMNRFAYPLPEAARIAGVSRTRIFDTVRKQELTIRRAGRA